MFTRRSSVIESRSKGCERGRGRAGHGACAGAGYASPVTYTWMQVRFVASPVHAQPAYSTPVTILDQKL